MRTNGLLFTGLALLTIGLGGLALLSFGVVGPPTADGAGQTAAQATGARIYWTGATLSGKPIPYRGGMMMRMGCAQCHGADGHGLRTPMFVSPDITYGNLTDPVGMREPDGDRGPTYTDELIKQAVTQGVDAEGKAINWPMPRWQLTDAEWQELLTFLRTLH